MAEKKKKKKEFNVYKVENGIQSDGSQRDLLTYWFQSVWMAGH